MFKKFKILWRNFWGSRYWIYEDETLTKYYKEEPKILYYGPSILITTYGKEFTPAA